MMQPLIRYILIFGFTIAREIGNFQVQRFMQILVGRYEYINPILLRQTVAVCKPLCCVNSKKKLTMRSLYSLGCLLTLTLVTIVLASPTGQPNASPKSLFGRKPDDYIIQRDDNNLQTMVSVQIHCPTVPGL